MKKIISVCLMIWCAFSSITVATPSLVAQAPVLTLAGAKLIAEHAAKKAKAQKWRVVIAITDASGEVKYLERMDQVQLASLAVAIAKAKTAVFYRRPTKVFEQRVKSGDVPVTMLPDVMPFEGGLPIVVAGHIIGAIGVSGVKSSQDAEIAQAGINALLKQLAK